MDNCSMLILLFERWTVSLTFRKRHPPLTMSNKRPCPSGAAAAIAKGDKMPDVTLDKGFPPQKVPLSKIIGGKKVVMVGLPGAFTPTWSSKQVPGYLAKQSELKAKGVTDVIVYCVNDCAVMDAWGRDLKIEGSMLSFYGDSASLLTKEIGMELTDSRVMAALGNPRCKRHAIIVDDMEVKEVFVAAAEDDPAGDGKPESTFVENILTYL